jgi:hypothetical protein
MIQLCIQHLGIESLVGLWMQLQIWTILLSVSWLLPTVECYAFLSQPRPAQKDLAGEKQQFYHSYFNMCMEMGLGGSDFRIW